MRKRRGDIMSAEKRSALMSRIKGKHTGPEKIVAEAIRRLGVTWEQHAKDLPGRPDFVSRQENVVVFVDGDFWHGWRFPAWRHKLSEFWETKLAGNRARDQRNQARLRRSGWVVVRLWEHQIERDLPGCLAKIERAINRTNKTAPRMNRSERNGAARI